MNPNLYLEYLLDNYAEAKRALEGFKCRHFHDSDSVQCFRKWDGIVSPKRSVDTFTHADSIRVVPIGSDSWIYVPINNIRVITLHPPPQNLEQAAAENSHRALVPGSKLDL